MKKIIFSLILMLSICCFAANEIHYFDTSGQSDIYARVTKASDFTIYDTGLTDYNDNPAWGVTDIAMTERDPNFNPGLYYASMPTSTAGRYYIEVYSGASPAKTDTRLQVYQIDWSGSAEITLASTLSANVTQIEGADATDQLNAASPSITGLFARTTTVAASSSTSQFTITAGKTTNNAYRNMLISVKDADDNNVEVRLITSYTGSTRTVTVDSAFSFTPTAGDVVYLINGYSIPGGWW